jgi:hypothetical protein
MSGNFVGIILGSLKALDPYRDRLRIETDDLSTLMIGPPDVLFAAMRDLFVAAAKAGEHCVLSAAVSRGCPGGPESDPVCGIDKRTGADTPLASRIEEATAVVQSIEITGQPAAAQFALYVMGSDDHMDEIMGCIEFLKASGTFDRAKNFVTKLRGDSGAIFATLQEALFRFGPVEGHVTLDITVSANSPSRA